MCGIDGLFSKTIVEENTVKGMTSCLVHRGPHAEGFFCDDHVSLGMRRLKVIDLDTGNQPIFNEVENIIVIFNGEIYNFHSLREDLVRKNHIFRSKTDTEVLVHGYEEWGISELLSRLNGMFAFCIYDKKKNKIYIARDRLGEKPLYYFYNEQDFVFGSELQSILESRKIPLRISKIALYSYLAVHYVPGDMCIIKDVKKLLPGHYLEFDVQNFTLKIVEYWDLKERNFIEKEGGDDYVNFIKKLVEDSVKIRMISDVPLGLFLSGGIDSSIIASVMKKLNPQVNTFSIGFSNPNFDESKFSKLIAEEYGTNHHHFILEPEKVIELLPKVIHYMDEPSGDQALLPLYWLSHEAKKFVTVVLGGEGSDEIFGGYSYYNASPKNNNDHVSRTEEILPEFFVENETSSGFPLISDFNARSKLIKNFDIDELKNELHNYLWFEKFRNNIKIIKDGLRIQQYTDIKTWLPDDLLMKFDKMSMSQSLEGRAPFLDHRLVEFAFNLPTRYKINENNSKFILREAFKDDLPEEIFQRKKQGFNLPMSEWLRIHLREHLEKLTEMSFNDHIDDEYLKTLIDEHLSGAERARLLYSILVYKLWIKNLVDRYGEIMP